MWHRWSSPTCTLAVYPYLKPLILVPLLLVVLLLPGCTPPPEAEVEASVTSGPAPLTVSFTNTSQNADECEWDFGDGTTMTTSTIEEPVTHEYTGAGTYTVTLTAIQEREPPETSTTTLTVTVKHGALDRVKLSLETVVLDIGQSQEFTTEVVDAYGNPIPEAELTWEVAERAGTVTSGGVLTAGTRAGTFDEGIVVTASLNTHSAEATASVTVKHGPVDRVKLSPETVVLDIGQSQEFTAEAVDAYDNPIPEAELTWEVAERAGTIADGGMLTAGTKAGTFEEGIVVTAKLGTDSAEATASVTVNPDLLASVKTTPVQAAAGKTQQLEAIATDRYGNRLSKVDMAWTVTDENAGSVTQAGLLTAGEVAGSFPNVVMVEATQEGLVHTATASVTIRPSPLEQVVIAPDPVEIGMEMTQQFIAVGADQYGNRISDLSFTWSVENSGGTIDESGIFTAGTTPGSYADTVKAEATHEGVTCSTTADVTVEPDRIVFTSDRNDGQWDIYIMEIDGSNQERLTTSGTDEEDPSCSPDGRRVVYSAQGDIWAINDDGGWKSDILWGRWGYEPAWSPDGTKIAFQSWEHDPPEIYVMDVDGGNLTRLTYNSAYDDYPAWSPDGTRIAFVSDRDGNKEIYVMNADGSNQRRLTNDPDIDTHPAWSPDGTEILFQSDRDWRCIHIMNADGSNVRRLTPTDYSSNCPSWSPDGTRIVFHSWQDPEQAEIYIMGRGGSNITRLTDNSALDYSPRWLPRKRGVEVTEASVIIPDTSTLKAMTTQEVTELARKAVVRIVRGDGSAGSGFIIDPSGVIMTNNHVISDAEEITVYLDDGTSYTGTVEARDLVRDLALVKIKATGLPYLELGDLSQVGLGQQVIVLGYPETEDVTVTTGVVSAFKFDSGSNITWVQTDTAINPGNSGGPMLDLRGRVIGVVTWKKTWTLGAGGIMPVEGVAFAISANTVNTYLPQLETGEIIAAFSAGKIADSDLVSLLQGGRMPSCIIMRQDNE